VQAKLANIHKNISSIQANFSILFFTSAVQKVLMKQAMERPLNMVQAVAFLTHLKHNKCLM
jgi:hypothetical protein